MSKAKVRYNEHLENPESKINEVKRGVKGRLIKVVLGSENATDDEKFLVHQSILEQELKLNSSTSDEQPQKNETCTATVEEIQKKAEAEMANPYNTSLSQFLALELP